MERAVNEEGPAAFAVFERARDNPEIERRVTVLKAAGLSWVGILQMVLSEFPVEHTHGK